MTAYFSFNTIILFLAGKIITSKQPNLLKKKNYRKTERGWRVFLLNTIEIIQMSRISVIDGFSNCN